MRKIRLLISIVGLAVVLAGCGTAADTKTTVDATEAEYTTDAAGQDSTGSDKVAAADEMVEPEEVVEEGMVPIYADGLQEGSYDIEVKSSSSMFKITKCKLVVADGKMTATMTMGGTGYLYLYMGTGEQAAATGEANYIPFVENGDGEHTFKVPVEALDTGIACAAFSKKKKKWYDRQLLFRADSLPQEAFGEGVITYLDLDDGVYTVDVVLEGGSGKASVESPATLTVKDGVAMATVIFSSPNYDYMIVDGEKYLPVNTEGNSTFEIPVLGFDYKMPVTADTVAMSTPHEIAYTLQFDSSSVKETDGGADASQ